MSSCCSSPAPVPAQSVLQFVNVTLPAGTTMTPSLLNKVRPGKNQGTIRLLEPVNVTLPYGTQFTTQSGPMHCTWTIGQIGQQVAKLQFEFEIPAGKQVVRVADESGLISLTQVAQKFLLETGVSVQLPEGTVAHCELVQVTFASVPVTLM